MSMLVMVRVVSKVVYMMILENGEMKEEAKVSVIGLSYRDNGGGTEVIVRLGGN